jgi:hypothetical protein
MRPGQTDSCPPLPPPPPPPPPQEGAASGCVHLPGTYPHDQWQGDRIEGFVVSRGQRYSGAEAAALVALAAPLRGAVVELGAVLPRLRCPYRDALAAAGGDAGAAKAKVRQRAAGARRRGSPSRLSAAHPRAMAIELVRNRCFSSPLADPGRLRGVAAEPSAGVGGRGAAGPAA